MYRKCIMQEMLISRYWSSIHPQTQRKFIKDLRTDAALVDIRNFYVPIKSCAISLCQLAQSSAHCLWNCFVAILLDWGRSQWSRGVRHEPPSPAPTLGSWGPNPTRGMFVCVRLFCVCVVLCVGSGLATGWSPAQVVLPTVYVLRNWKSGQGPQGL
jgi:hypothetical protein